MEKYYVDVLRENIKESDGIDCYNVNRITVSIRDRNEEFSFVRVKRVIIYPPSWIEHKRRITYEMKVDKEVKKMQILCDKYNGVENIKQREIGIMDNIIQKYNNLKR